MFSIFWFWWISLDIQIEQYCYLCKFFGLLFSLFFLSFAPFTFMQNIMAYQYWKWHIPSVVSRARYTSPNAFWHIEQTWSRNWFETNVNQLNGDKCARCPFELEELREKKIFQPRISIPVESKVCVTGHRTSIPFQIELSTKCVLTLFVVSRTLLGNVTVFVPLCTTWGGTSMHEAMRNPANWNANSFPSGNYAFDASKIEFFRRFFIHPNQPTLKMRNNLRCRPFWSTERYLSLQEVMKFWNKDF